MHNKYYNNCAHVLSQAFHAAFYNYKNIGVISTLPISSVASVHK